MNGLYDLKTSNDLFKKAQKDYESFCNDPKDYDLFNLLATLNHLREWICPAGYDSYKNKKNQIIHPKKNFIPSYTKMRTIK